MSFFKQLFNADHPETAGDRLVFLIFKTIITIQVIHFVWTWAFVISGYKTVASTTGIAKYMNISFMFAPLPAYLNSGVITLFILLGYFKKGQLFYLLALLGMHLQYVARFSQGYIWHGSNLTGMALLVLALTTLLFKNQEQRRKITLGLFIFFMALGYTSAGFSKLIGTGFHWVDGSNLILWIKDAAAGSFAAGGAFHLNALQQLIVHHEWLGTLLLSFGLAIELCSLLLCFKKTRWIIATLLILMHVCIELTMGISFIYFFTFLIITGYPWARGFDTFLQRMEWIIDACKKSDSMI